MIERYTLPEMGGVWSLQNKFQKWLDVEIAVCEVHAEDGTIPTDALAEISADAVLLPMVILTILIERFHVTVEEDGLVYAYRAGPTSVWEQSTVESFGDTGHAPRMAVGGDAVASANQPQEAGVARSPRPRARVLSPMHPVARRRRASGVAWTRRGSHAPGPEARPLRPARDHDRLIRRVRAPARALRLLRHEPRSFQHRDRSP